MVSIIWAPWASRGMVSAELQRQFEERGVQFVTPDLGRRIFDREVRYGRKGEVEVVVAGGTWDGVSLNVQAVATRPLPMLQNARVLRGDSGATIEVVRVLDPSHDLYLNGHQLYGKPVMPIAAVIELMAEVASQGWPELEVVGLRDIKVFRGIVVDDGPIEVRVAARPVPDSAPVALEMEVHVEITEPDRAGQRYYRAILELADRLPEPPLFEAPYSADMQPFHTSVDEAYDRYLFQGPPLRSILEIEGVSEEGIVGTLAPSSPQQILTGVTDGQWLIDPVVLEGGFQLTIVWTRLYADKTPLPSIFHAYRRYGLLSDHRDSAGTPQPIRCYVYSFFDPDGVVMHTDLYWVNSGGRVLGVLKDAESACSRALNRLTESESAQTRNVS